MSTPIQKHDISGSCVVLHRKRNPVKRKGGCRIAAGNEYVAPLPRLRHLLACLREPELIREPFTIAVPGILSVRLVVTAFWISWLVGVCGGHVVLKIPPAQKSGAVASECKECSEVGIDLLRRGVSYLLLSLGSREGGRY
jgi:hypothetical protein